MSPLPLRFAHGQCWTSESEPELGIGFVRAYEGQMVRLEFPLTGEMRTYNLRSAPLKRMELRAGDTLQTAQGKSHLIEGVEEREGLRVYATSAGEIAETELSPKLRIHRPLQRFLAGHWDPLRAFDLRQQTLRLAAEHRASIARGFLGGRARLLPHQLYVASQVTSRSLPRVLLADEVGLGKTIEAGWILHRQMAQGRARRALVIVPPALVNQWFVELLRRFNLSFWVPSSQSEEALTAQDVTEQERLILSNTHLADPEIAQGLLESHWDLVIVDEAHRIDLESPEHKILEQLAVRSPGLLLLTATPEQLGLRGHFERLRLLDPVRFASFESFQAEHERYLQVSRDAQALLEQGVDGRRRALELIDRHGTGRAYFRNSRKVVEQEGFRFPKRKLRDHELAARSPKNDDLWLSELAKQLRGEKTLVICSTPERAAHLEKILRDQHGIKAAAFHEKLPLLARDRSAAYFAEPDGASILIASELGGEGRNFQHARHLVLLDLPEDPDALEQRIGRLDRIGGQTEIEIHVPVQPISPSARLLRWHDEVFGAFSAPVQGAASQIFQRYQGALKGALESGQEFEALIKRARSEYQEAQAQIDAGRDRLIELQSFDAERAIDLVGQLSARERPIELRQWLEIVFDVLGVHVEDLDADSQFVEAGDSAFASYVPALPPEGIRFTYSRERSLLRDDLTLMSWDHPLVTGLQESVAGQELGNTAVAAWAPTAGEHPLVVEAHFVLEASCDARYALSEFFTPAPLRIVMEGNGKELTPQWSPEKLRAAIGPLPPQLAEMAKRLPGDALKRLLIQGRKLAEEHGDNLREQALDQLKTTAQREITRLDQLGAASGHVHSAERQAWVEREAILTAAIQTAEARLDAFMLILPAGLGRAK